MKAKEKLVKALEEANAPDAMIHLAREGYYDDFESPLATPIIQLVYDLHRLELHDLANRAKRGEFDSN